jgi:hypothetical protein
MGIHITLFPQERATAQEAVLGRLRVCYEAMRFFKEGLFFAQDAEIWVHAPSESLGGSLKKTFPAENLYEVTEAVNGYLNTIPFDQLIETFIVFKGKWEFDNVALSGYFSVNNDAEWRKVYGDIEISAYAKAEFEDIVDAFWATQKMVTLIPMFVQTLQRGIEKTGLGISQVAFSRGIPTEEDPSNLMALYLVGERRGLLNVFYRARRKSMDPDIVAKAEPLNTFFFLKTLMSQRVVMERINRKLSQTMVAEVQSRSALYIAKERSSFEKLYNEISKTILKPAVEKLPKEEAVKNAILEGLEEYREPE